MAVQVAKLLGAAHVAAAGRGADKLAGLAALGADTLVDLARDDAARALGEAGEDVDVVIDYLWGKPTADALDAIIPARTDDARPLTWIQIGSVAGRESPIPSAALRAARLDIVGSGQGAVPTRDIVAELPALAAEIGTGRFRIAARAVPLADVDAARHTRISTGARARDSEQAALLAEGVPLPATRALPGPAWQLMAAGRADVDGGGSRHEAVRVRDYARVPTDAG